MKPAAGIQLSGLTAPDIDSSFIRAEKLREPLNAHAQWYVRNRKSDAILGIVFWYPAWRQFCFTQYESGVVWSHDCLRSVADFCLYRTKEKP
jgi:hypothetical protein